MLRQRILLEFSRSPDRYALRSRNCVPHLKSFSFGAKESRMSVTYLSQVRETRRSSIALSILAGVALAMLAISPEVVSANTACGPFGDPPQTLISNPIPICLGGTVLGPWSDSDGTPRYACLYQPASATTASPLPLLVWLHPSLVTADSIISTNILSFQNDFSLAPGTKGFVVLTPEGRRYDAFLSRARQPGPRMGQLVPAVCSRRGDSQRPDLS